MIAFGGGHGSFPPDRTFAVSTTASGYNQGCRLMNRDPFLLSMGHQTNDGAIGRVDLYDFDAMPVCAGLDPFGNGAVSKT